MRGLLASVTVPATLLLITLAMRFPFYFPDVIDWDESTYVLIGQSILDGNLPYIDQWTLKPPLLFAFFAIVLGIGKSLIAVRVAGTLCVVAAATLVYLAARRHATPAAAFFGAALCPLAVSFIPSGQATTTEIVLLPSLTAVLWLMSGSRSTAALFSAGALVAVATLIRLNTAFAVLAAAAFILWRLRGEPRRAVTALAAYAAGGLTVLALTVLPYAIAGELPLLWRSLVVAPLAYAGSQYSAFDNGLELVRNSIGAIGPEWEFDHGVLWINGLLFLTGVLGAVTSLRSWSKRRPAERDLVTVALLMAAATAWGMVSGGAFYAHYLIQLVPFAAVLATALLSRLPPLVLGVTAGAALLLAGLSFSPIAAEYGEMISRRREGKALQYGTGVELAAYFREHNTEHRPVYLLSTHHIAYWIAGTPPPTPLSTHPSNIWKEYLVKAMSGENATTETELDRIFQRQPEFVVVAFDDFVTLNPRAWIYLQNILERDFSVSARIRDQVVYRRRHG